MVKVIILKVKMDTWNNIHWNKKERWRHEGGEGRDENREKLSVRVCVYECQSECECEWAWGVMYFVTVIAGDVWLVVMRWVAPAAGESYLSYVVTISSSDQHLKAPNYCNNIVAGLSKNPPFVIF